MDENHADQENCDNEDLVAIGHVAELPKLECRACRQSFRSNNRLYRHLRAGCHHSKAIVKAAPDLRSMWTSTSSMSAQPNGTTFVRSIATDQPSSDGYVFRGWRYATADARLSPNVTNQPICLDTGCTMTLIDRRFLKEQASGTAIHNMSSPIPVRGLSSTVHQSNQYARVDIHLPETNGQTAVISREAHIVEDLKAKMLVGMDILAPEGITMNLPRKIAVIGSCGNIEIPLTITTKPANQVQHIILFKRRITIPPRSNLAVAVIPPELPQGRDFRFEPDCRQSDAAVYAHIVDHAMTEVHVRNNGEFPLIIPPKSRMGQVVVYEAEGCYPASADDAILASTSRRHPMRQGWVRTAMRGLLAAAAVFQINVGLLDSPSALKGWTPRLLGTPSPDTPGVIIDARCTVPMVCMCITSRGQTTFCQVLKVEGGAFDIGNAQE